MMLPHGVPKQAGGGSNTGRKRNSGLNVVVILATAIPSFFLGTLTSLLTGGMMDCNTGSNTLQQQNQSNKEYARENRRLEDRIKKLQEQQQSEIQRLVDMQLHQAVEMKCAHARVLENEQEHAIAEQHALPLFPTESVGRYAVGMARTPKQEFTDAFDLGVPLDPPGNDEVLILYQKASAMPKSMQENEDEANHEIPHVDMPDAVQHCDYLNMVFTDHSGSRNQCLAIVPQYESFHLQRWMRLKDPVKGKLDSSGELTMVSRGRQSNGLDQFAPPDLEKHTRKHWTMLQNYLTTVDVVLSELKPLLEKIAIDNTVIVMVCNFGQSQLLVNFVCAAHARKLDISNVIVFATDQETTDLAESIGLTAYFDHRNFGDIPSEAANQYGDAKFVAMMMAKVICVQLVSMLGYDFLFQDVDIVWFKHPLPYFQQKEIQNYDVFFQDDGGHSLRYAPYSANSGFYFIRYNQRTRHFMTSLLMAGDLILKTDSHQQALIATLNEHVSLYGLKAKVLARTEEEFPGGYQYHQRSKEYMKKFFKGEYKPYIFHMSWTKNKDNKLKFFRQMGEWYVKDECVDHKVAEILDGEEKNDHTDLIPTCCTAEPLFSCHYRDKPSTKPCKDSPPIDEGRPSWW